MSNPTFWVSCEEAKEFIEEYKVKYDGEKVEIGNSYFDKKYLEDKIYKYMIKNNMYLDNNNIPKNRAYKDFILSVLILSFRQP